MRARSLAIVFVVTAGATLTMLGLACSTPSSPPHEADSSSSTSAGPEAAPPSAEPTAGTASEAGDPSKPAPGEPQSDITNEAPDGGVVMNNATTAADAGASDRLEAVHTLIKANRDKYRACFDIWGKKNPAAGEVPVDLAFELDPGGKVTSVGYAPHHKGMTDKAVETCMSDATRSIPFPPSPSDKETSVVFPFRFKSRK